MNLDLYLKPVDFSKYTYPDWVQKKYTFGSILEKNQEKLSPEKAKVVIVGVDENRNAIKKGGSKAPDKIREHLYALNRIAPRYKVLDLGDIRRGKKPNDTYFALRDVCSYFIDLGIQVIVIGGSQDLTFGISKAFDEKPFNLVNVDPKIDYKKGTKSINSENYLNFILEKQEKLFYSAILACQNYFIDPLEIDQLSGNNTDFLRLGKLREDISDVEPYLRDADIFSFDLNSVRQVEAPGQYFVSPNGLYAEEACQIAHYAGMAVNQKVAGFFNYYPNLDLKGISGKLMAQIIWHFLDGTYHRVIEKPNSDSDFFNEFVVDIEDIDFPLVFFESKRTGRWWMKIAGEDNDYENIIACSSQDYDSASKSEIPDRWWKNMRFLNKLLK